MAAVASALKLAEMQRQGDSLPGDVIVTTHICPDAPTRPHEPVDFMDSPVETEDMNEQEVSDEMDAVLSIDTTKGNRIINHKGFAISPTVKQGYILRVSDDLLRVMEMTTGQLPVTFPITRHHPVWQRRVSPQQHFATVDCHCGTRGRCGDHGGERSAGLRYRREP